jgi:tripartite-type tricarboxylate transporter receptor subunit TctC
VNPSVPANTIAELIALVRANPGKYSFSSCGHGTPLHLAGELLNLSARIDMVHVPYRGCSPALADAVSGQVPIFFNMISNSLPHAKNGKVRLLASASLQRLASQPQLPTIAESGFPAFDAYPWFGILAPAGTPREIVQMLSNELAAAVQSAEIGDKLRGMNFEPTVATPESFTDIMRNDLVRWGRVVREAKVKAAPE